MRQIGCQEINETYGLRMVLKVNQDLQLTLNYLEMGYQSNCKEAEDEITEFIADKGSGL